MSCVSFRHVLQHLSTALRAAAAPIPSVKCCFRVLKHSKTKDAVEQEHALLAQEHLGRAPTPLVVWLHFCDQRPCVNAAILID